MTNTILLNKVHIILTVILYIFSAVFGSCICLRIDSGAKKSWPLIFVNRKGATLNSWQRQNWQ